MKNGRSTVEICKVSKFLTIIFHRLRYSPEDLLPTSFILKKQANRCRFNVEYMNRAYGFVTDNGQFG